MLLCDSDDGGTAFVARWIDASTAEVGDKEALIGGGVTALLSVPMLGSQQQNQVQSHDSSSTKEGDDSDWHCIAVGTKRGDFLLFRATSGKIIQRMPMLHSIVNNNDRRPGPIYAIATCCSPIDGGLAFFTGAMDRFVSVWHQQPGSDVTGRTPRLWYRIQQLGLHTGWVKDILYDHHNQRLHSIGCNCIETWEADETNRHCFKHMAKSTIERSSRIGGTFSSDLLCLHPVNDSGSWFVAGGVDGRIHLWDSATLGHPVSSVVAHAGRVAAITARLIKDRPEETWMFSGGYDGKLQCWTCFSTGDVSNNNSEFISSSHYRLQLESSLDLGPDVRITALSYIPCSVRSDNSLSFPIGFLIAGTHHGQVLIVQVNGATIANSKYQPRTYNQPVLELIQQLQLPGLCCVTDIGMVVHAICNLSSQPISTLRPQSPIMILIGHSQGLATIEFRSTSDY